LSNEEKTGLLRAALLDRENLSPELLAVKNAEIERRIREQIERVLNAPPEARPKALDTESSDIAQRVIQSQAALDSVKKVSDRQFPSSYPPATSGIGIHTGAVVVANVTQCPGPLTSGSRRNASQSSVSAISSASWTAGRLKGWFSRHKGVNSVSEAVIEDRVEGPVGASLGSQAPGMSSRVPEPLLKASPSGQIFPSVDCIVPSGLLANYLL
jgi:hypothetical protein